MLSRAAIARAAVAAAIAVCALVAFAGCGGGDDNADSGPYPFYGVAPEGLQNATDYERMHDGGVGTIRAVLQWSAIESSKGEYDWTSSDQILTQLALAGLEPLVTVYGTPQAYASEAIDAPTNDEKTFDAWADFLKAAVARYGTDGDFWKNLSQANADITPQPIREWEIWNEPNSSTFWAPTPDPAAYADLLTRSAKIIHEGDPEARVMSAGMFATPQSDGAIVSYDFLKSMFDESGVADAVDVVGVHPYGPDAKSVIDQVKKTRQALDDAGSEAPMWATEIGWGSNPKSGNDLSKTPEDQADLLSTSFGELSDQQDELGLDGVVWYTWHDSTDNAVGACGWCASAGLVDADRDSKPAWIAFTDLTGGTP